ncbi:uncharacterized protein BDW47DRAFT_109611 [Aspergillus candidus]|uniref:Uncharacterized protein n=1 Tax=Aspergillus candidus TaxID=41067 RepID=A0A2I2F5C8_ASPCN|nr:hypothetical protein BDW47DRAFT_109611 [Aspergillus candidus]PLB35852.1 hypothetical protein BDW47DRAFT_109611 [Aspergillus candidus]
MEIQDRSQREQLRTWGSIPRRYIVCAHGHRSFPVAITAGSSGLLDAGKIGSKFTSRTYLASERQGGITIVIYMLGVTAMLDENTCNISALREIQCRLAVVVNL